MDIYKRIEDMGIVIPDPPKRGGVYEPIKTFGKNFAYVSGCGNIIKGTTELKGKVGKDLTFEQGQLAARNCILNILAVLDAKLGDLGNIQSIVKITAFVASDPGFTEQPGVADAASSLLIDIFGEKIGCSSRSAIGVNVLPANIPVEIEMLVELKVV